MLQALTICRESSHDNINAVESTLGWGGGGGGGGGGTIKLVFKVFLFCNT